MKKINDLINDILLFLGTTLAMAGGIVLYVISFDLMRFVFITITILILIKIYFVNLQDKKSKSRQRKVTYHEKCIHR